MFANWEASWTNHLAFRFKVGAWDGYFREESTRNSQVPGSGNLPNELIGNEKQVKENQKSSHCLRRMPWEKENCLRWASRNQAQGLHWTRATKPKTERKNKPTQVIVDNRQLISKSAKEGSLRTLTHALSCNTHIYFLINSSRTEQTGLTAPNHQRWEAAENTPYVSDFHPAWSQGTERC